MLNILEQLLFGSELALTFIAYSMLLAFFILDISSDGLAEKCLGNLLLANLAFHGHEGKGLVFKFSDIWKNVENI